jgi:hypothetical protein
MTEVLDAYSETEFAAIIDFLPRTADVLVEQARRTQEIMLLRPERRTFRPDCDSLRFSCKSHP